MRRLPQPTGSAAEGSRVRQALDEWQHGVKCCLMSRTTQHGIAPSRRSRVFDNEVLALAGYSMFWCAIYYQTISIICVHFWRPSFDVLMSLVANSQLMANGDNSRTI